MKEVVNVNVGGRAFTMDCDAYRKLSDYLADVDSRLEDSSTIDDIEGRIAEILYDMQPSSAMVITLAMVEKVIVQMGPAEQYGPIRRERMHNHSFANDISSRQLRRSRTDRSIAGVCGGLAKWLDVDSTAMRVVMLIFFFFGGMSLWVYIILWLLIPEE